MASIPTDLETTQSPTTAKQLPASSISRPSSKDEVSNPISSSIFPGQARGHGSFSAGNIQSPVSANSLTSPNVGGGPGVIGRIGLLKSANRYGEAVIESESGDDPVSPSENKPAVHRLNASGSVQAIAVDNDVLFAGLQGGEIVAWSLHTYQVLARVYAHQQSVLGLSLSEDRNLLFSCGVDSVVNVWSTQSLKRLYSLASRFEIGDIFCITYSTRLKTLFYGAQNSRIQWYELEKSETPVPLGTSKHRFFDSLGPGGVPSPQPQRDGINGAAIPQGGVLANVSQANYLQYAHKSYIYAMLIAKGLVEDDIEQEILITAGGGGTIKLWAIEVSGLRKPQMVEKFKNKGSSVYSLAYQAPFLFAGLSNGVVHVYNLASRQLVRKLHMGCGDVLQTQLTDKFALCGTSDGWVKRTSNRFTEIERWRAHKGKILATAISSVTDAKYFVTGGNDNTIAFWDLTDKSVAPTVSSTRGNDELINALRQFVSYRTVANNPDFVSECHQAALFLQKQFNSFGANTSFISPREEINPILLAKFQATSKQKRNKTILFYGHYDVVDAESSNGWVAQPFSLSALNGYLYGRGVTDNKGPILAALYAVADLSQQEQLTTNVVFLLEGDEEAGSRGFRSAVQQHKDDIGEVDFIMLSNSYWLDDHIPCLTFGMRGVVHASLSITSSRPDLHSGVDGRSKEHEPLKDLTALLGSLIGRTGTDINVPHFYDTIDKLHPNEMNVYSTITSTLGAGHPEIRDEQAFMRSLMQKWRDPSLTVHQIQVPESKTAVTISRSAKSTLSIRIVPSQKADEIADQLKKFLEAQFLELKSTNQLKVVITSKADPWLGKISSEIYSTLKEAVTEVWSTEDTTTSQRSFPETADAQLANSQISLHHKNPNLMASGTFNATNTPREPLFIREGGSIPAISFLEKEFGAPAAMFPMGQASDNAHLSNERMRLENLYKGREVLKKVFSRL